MQSEEPIFETARERNQYYLFIEKSKQDLKKVKSVPAVKEEPKKVFNPIEPRERKNAFKRRHKA